MEISGGEFFAARGQYLLTGASKRDKSISNLPTKPQETQSNCRRIRKTALAAT
jgi:hypothetical protein